MAERSKWKMSDGVQTEGVIGPNAILQLLPQIEGIGGQAQVARMLADAGVDMVPDGSQMIPEGQAARLHQALRRDAPEMAPLLASEAGHATARYILAHRIPVLAQRALRALPAGLAARALSRAIAKHAWTFAGSGHFRVVTPWVFEIAQNPIVRGEHSPIPLCHWHSAVFTQLYQTLVAPDCRCTETACCAVTGHGACRFVVTRG